MRYRTKVLLTLLAVVGVFGSLLALSHWKAEILVFKLIQEKVLAIAVSAATQVDGNAHERIENADDDGNEDYLKVRKVLRDVRDANQGGDIPVKFVYTYRPVDAEHKKWVYVVDAEEDGSDDKSTVGEEVELDQYTKGLFPKLDEANVDSVFITDSYGTWLSAWAPVKNLQGESVALLGVDIAADAVVAQRRSLFFRGLAAVTLAILAVGVASVFLSARLVAPLSALSKQVALIRDGDLSTRIPIDSNDEFGELADAVHQMADGLQEREAFKEALVRFVASGTTDSVIKDSDKSGASDASRRVTVLAASLQNMENVTNSLAADKAFGFLSDWYSTMIDIILRHHGSLEKSAGTSVTATFGAPLNDPDQERHALEAALTMEQELSGLRRRWGIPDGAELAIVSAIHTGHVTVTSEESVQVMEVASLQRIIGVISVIQEAVKSPEKSIFITEATADGLKGAIPLSYFKSIEIGGTGELISLHVVQMPDSR